jgi:hypothetical protein
MHSLPLYAPVERPNSVPAQSAQTSEKRTSVDLGIFMKIKNRDSTLATTLGNSLEQACNTDLTPLDRLAFLGPNSIPKGDGKSMELKRLQAQTSCIDDTLELARLTLKDDMPDISTCGEFAKDSAQSKSRADTFKTILIGMPLQGATCSREYYATYPLEHFDFEADWYRQHFLGK